MTQQHTEGPWGFNEVAAEIFRADGGVEPLIATVNVENTSDVQARADGRLIAAAPDCFDANVATVNALAEHFDIRPDHHNDDYIYDTMGSVLSGAFFKARAALTRATEG